SVEEHHLVGVGHGLIIPNMAHVDPALRKHQFCGRRIFFRALLTAAGLAAHVSYVLVSYVSRAPALVQKQIASLTPLFTAKANGIGIGLPISQDEWSRNAVEGKKYD